MFLADIHCDALMKMSDSGHEHESFSGPSSALVNKMTLQKGQVDIQNFALFVSPNLSFEKQLSKIKHQISIFKQSIARDSWVNHNPFEKIPTKKSGKLHAILSLEGASVFAEKEEEWDWLKSQGVEMISLTWNEKNKLAAGSDHSNKYGLTKRGSSFVDWMNKNKIVVDTAHLNEKSFWDVIEKAERVAVSHANVYRLHPHPRNLKDEQIQALLHKNGFLGLTFYPLFINGTNKANFTDIARQLDYLGERGALSITGFGSDFDGTDAWVDGLQSPANFPKLVEWLLRYFDEEIVKGVCGLHFARYWNNQRNNIPPHL